MINVFYECSSVVVCIYYSLSRLISPLILFLLLCVVNPILLFSVNKLSKPSKTATLVCDKYLLRSRENLLTFRIFKTFERVRLWEPYARNAKNKLGVTTLVSEINYVVDHVKLPNLVIVAVLKFICFWRKMKAFRPLEGRRCDEIILNGLSRLL